MESTIKHKESLTDNIEALHLEPDGEPFADIALNPKPREDSKKPEMTMK